MQYQIPQVAHAVAEFAQMHEQYTQWHRDSNYIVVLSVKTEHALHEFIEKCKKKGVTYIPFIEPDIGHAITAVALVPSEQSRKACSGIPLAGKNFDPTASAKLSKVFDLTDAMMDCKQTEGQSVLDHGLSVYQYTKELIEGLKGGNTLEGWKVPEAVLKNRELLLSNVYQGYVLEKYCIFHDCGKPFCQTTGDDGKTHFSDHSKVSHQKWMETFGDPEVGVLIEHDMVMHTMSTVDEAKQFVLGKDRKTLCTLSLVALAELHSNAKMFGGIESVSFKMKYKKLAKNITRVLSYM